MMKRKYTRKPNFIIYYLFRFICICYTKICYCLKCHKNDVNGTKGPLVIICNHGMANDFMTLVACTKRRINLVMSNSFYQTINLHYLFNACGIIHKQQFQTSLNNMKAMKEVCDYGGILGIYPAGLMTENGLSTPIPPSTGKFLKWLNQDIYVAYSIGDYLSNPKWSKVKRKGRIDIQITKLISKEQLKNIDVNNLDKMIEEKLFFDEYQTQEKRMQKYHNGSNVEGLEKVLYKCPKCEKEYTMKSFKNTLTCTECGNTVVCDNYCFLHPATNNDVGIKHISDWYQWIEKEQQKIITEESNYTLFAETDIHMLDYKLHKFVYVSKGNIMLDKDGVTLKTIINNKGIEKHISLTPSTPFKTGKFIELQNDQDIYRCYITNSDEIMKWIITLKYYYNCKNKNVK